MLCGQCGKEWIEGEAFCPLCGAPVCLVEGKKPATIPQTGLMKIIALVFLLCSMGLFFVSVWQPAFCIQKDGACHLYLTPGAGFKFQGGILLLLGWAGMVTCPIVGMTWLANPSLMMAWITFWFPKTSFWFSLIAVAFSAAFLLCIGAKVPINEAGTTAPICHLYLGYWLWLSSTLVMFAGNGIQVIVLYYQQKRLDQIYRKQDLERFSQLPRL